MKYNFRNYNLGRKIDNCTKKFERELRSLVRKYHCYMDTESINVDENCSGDLSKKELAKLKEVLTEFERETIRDTGIRSLNGSFAVAEMFDYDDDYIDIELKWGVQCGGDDDSTHTETYKVNRKTWKIEEA